jgi:4-amino-4-deoxy-L-arabinose transferase-like glycosyltransferase
VKFGLDIEESTKVSLKFGRMDFVVIAAMIAAGLAIRLYFLPSYDVISNDGTAYVKVAREMRIGNFAGVASYGFYPVFIWLAGFIVEDLETAGRLVSVIFGSLLCVPVYMLGSELFSRRTAFAACMAVIIWHSLRHWSCEVMTQSSYVALATAGIYCIWRMMRSSSPVAGLLAGLFLGLAYVTRTEAILLCILTPLPLIVACHREIRTKIPALLAYIAVFALIVGANLLLVRNATGSWQLASKTSVALIDAISYIKKIPDMNYIPGVESTGYLQILRDYPSFLFLNSLKNIMALLKTLIPLPFWVLLIIGIASGGMNAGKNVVRLFLLSTFAPLGVIIVYYYVGPEYTQPYIPMILLFCAEGLRVAENFLVSRIPAAALP